ncbi:Ulp1 family isopeptidase [Rickettsiales endosymbiont of Stachyamoeba lipophora]|uniref:Ulp1 family isopeptidase n=1 Tax=Rickettsiales endosymbiont of Stachyamoeba lipophora TaxID=2486578 RepID=UPI000F653005|nr:Ulp1 family isopeptidase [Rickettsiales endosymbiont of Stachyamoeba lipophora]AZL15634.1 hypothetical protein EF513_03605 [Rickettsiales endosymbiont of Stachyamoeba lipophora]
MASYSTAANLNGEKAWLEECYDSVHILDIFNHIKEDTISSRRVSSAIEAVAGTSFDYLSQLQHEQDYIKDIKEDLNNNKKLLGILHQEELSHWVSFIAQITSSPENPNIKTLEVICFNSLQTDFNRQQQNSLNNFFGLIAAQLNINYTRIRVNHVPGFVQKDDQSCGPLAVLNLLCHVGELKLKSNVTFTPKALKYIRRLQYRFANKELNFDQAIRRIKRTFPDIFVNQPKATKTSIAPENNQPTILPIINEKNTASKKPEQPLSFFGNMGDFIAQHSFFFKCLGILMGALVIATLTVDLSLIKNYLQNYKKPANLLNSSISNINTLDTVSTQVSHIPLTPTSWLSNITNNVGKILAK